MKFILPFTIFITLLYSCDAQKQQNAAIQTQPSVEYIHSDVDKATAKKIVAESKDLIIIDVRTPEEVALGKMEGALEMDIKSDNFRGQLTGLDHNKPYLVYCHAGGRSATAMEIMKEMGFKQVFNLSSGFRTWNDK